MGTTAVLEAREIRQAFPPAPERAATLEQRTQMLLNLAARVEAEWDEIPEHVRAALLYLVDRVSNPPRGISAVGPMIVGGVLYAVCAWQGRLEALGLYISAALSLADSVMSAQERENVEYQEFLSTAIEAALDEESIDEEAPARKAPSGGRRGMTAAELSEWSRSV